MIVRGKCGPVLISVRECAPIERVHSCASRVEVVNEKYDRTILLDCETNDSEQSNVKPYKVQR